MRLPKRPNKKFRKPRFDKYEYYFKSVQSPEADIDFLRRIYLARRGRPARSLREDFCAAFANCCEWVRRGPEQVAYGIDLDPEPLAYGKKHYLPLLKEEQQKRIHTLQMNVLSKKLPQTDLIAAMNFSYFIFKTRNLMKDYFRSCREHLRPNGILVLDCFGGSEAYDAHVEKTIIKKKVPVLVRGKTVMKNFEYQWDQAAFDPITNDAKFYIHFKVGSRLHARQFVYDWRLWSIPELRDILEEVGFKSTHVYWEGTDKKGSGNGIFREARRGEEAQSWIAYIVALK
jgi:SAM-dependent methyltransferase